jgi:archaellum biogenesis ATPase FlaH
LAWWQEIFPTLERATGNYTFPCVFHDEVNGEALSLRVLPNGNVIAYCHGKCGTDLWHRVSARFHGESVPETFEAESFSDRSSSSSAPPHLRPLQLVPGVALSPLEELAQYTGVSIEFLKTQDLRESAGSLEFFWPGKRVVKIRPLPFESKVFTWAPPKTYNPPFWPTVSDELPEEIVITEGESDCLVVRSLDVPAWGLTKGGGAKLSPAIFTELKKRGARTVYLVPDVDETGRISVDRLSPLIEAAELEVRVIKLDKYVQVMDGEKDLRALYLRVGASRLREILDDAFLTSLSAQVKPVLASDVLAAEYHVDWLAPGIVARGSMTLLSGQPKAGKTTFVMKLAGAFQKGDSFLNRVCKPARVLLLTENRSVALQEKLKLLPPNANHVYVIDRYRRELVELSWDDTVKVVFDAARDAKVDVIVLDTFMAWARLEDENSSTEVLQALDPLSRAVEKTNIALIIVHHLNKDGTSPRGSGAFQAECDTVADLTHSKGGGRRLRVVSNIVKEPVDDLVFSYDGERYTIEDDVADPFDSSILSTLELTGTTTLEDLIPELDQPYNSRSPQTVQLRLNKLVERGLIRREAGGVKGDPARYSLGANDQPNFEVRRVRGEE